MSDERETEGVDGSTRLLAGEMGLRPMNNDPEGDGAEEKLVTEDGKLNSNREISEEVKFISADSQNGDAKIDIENVKHTFAGMGKDELMKFANDPFWIRMRWFLFIFFWLLWIAMLVGAVAIIVLAPKCDGPAPLKWWEESPLYEVNVRSFVDGEKEDGIGDIVGLKSKLDYIKSLGVKGILLSSVLQSSHKFEDGYVEDFLEVDPLVGTVQDFTNLTAAMKEEGLHLILDFIPNHTSMKHEWFVRSERKESPYTDYYVWVQTPPNWVSLYGGPAWNYSDIRKEYYLHQFKPDQPDLNFRSDDVINEFKNIMKTWLERGVSGFQMSHVEFLLEDEKFGDEVVNPHNLASLDQYDFLSHSKTANVPGLLNVLTEFRNFTLNVSSESVLAVSSNVTLYGGLVRDSNMARAFDIMRNADLFSSLKHNFTADELNHAVNGWMRDVPKGYRTFWELGNANRSRVASRLSPDVVDGLNAVVMLLPGTPITFYGDELGMSDSKGERQALAPMSWRNDTGAGFSANESIKASSLSLNFQEKNVETEERSEDSHLGIYRTLSTKARTSRSIMYGVFESTVYNDTVYAYTRLKSGNPGYLVVFNPSDYEITANLKDSLKGMSDDLTLVVKSPHIEDRKFQASSLYLPAKSMGVFTFVPQPE